MSLATPSRTRQYVAAYTTMDLSIVRQLDRRMRAVDLGLWIDVDHFRPDTRWDALTEAALDECGSVAFVLSQFWDYDDRLVADLSTALAPISARANSLSAAYINLGANTIPEALTPFPWLEISLDGNPAASGVAAAFSTEPKPLTPEDLSHWQTFFDTYDPMLDQLRRALRHRLDEAFDYWNEQQLDLLEAVWAPFEGSPFFDLHHPVWKGNPGLFSRLHLAKSFLFMSAVQLGQTEVGQEHFVRMAFERLREVVAVAPFAHGPGALPLAQAEITNANYRDNLDFALSWFEQLSSGRLHTLNIPVSDAMQLRQDVVRRLADLNRVL